MINISLKQKDDEAYFPSERKPSSAINTITWTTRFTITTIPGLVEACSAF
jgi:hypothetical protein